MINTHSDSTNADIPSFIPDIHCLSVWLVASDYIQLREIQSMDNMDILLFSRVSAPYWGRAVLMMELEFCPSWDFREELETADTGTQTLSRRRGLGNHNGSI